MELLATGVNGNQPGQTFTVHYTDGSSQTFTQSISDWHTPQNMSGETVVVSTKYRNTFHGGRDTNGPFDVYGYAFTLDSTKTVQSITLPNNGRVEVLAISMVAPVAAPMNLTAKATSSNTVNLSWTAAIGTITGYNVYRGTSAGSESTTPLNSSPVGRDGHQLCRFHRRARQYILLCDQGDQWVGISPNSNETGLTLSLSGSAAQVNLAGDYNLTGITTNGRDSQAAWTVAATTCPEDLLGSSVTAGGVAFLSDAAGAANVVRSLGQTISLPAGSFSTLELLATGVNGNQVNQTFVVHYSDGTSKTFTQSLSDWYTPEHYAGESVALSMAYRDQSSGGEDHRPFAIYAYAALDSSKTVASITLPNNKNVEVLAMTAVH